MVSKCNFLFDFVTFASHFKLVFLLNRHSVVKVRLLEKILSDLAHLFLNYSFQCAMIFEPMRQTLVNQVILMLQQRKIDRLVKDSDFFLILTN